MRMQDGSGAGVRSACAACKHQRKKCSEKCILSCYFPAEKNRAFKAVHKVFGVSNITKIIKNVKEDDERRRVVDSLVWEACCRQKDPVHGPYGEYRKLFEEYIRVFNELKLHRSMNHQTPHNHHHHNNKNQHQVSLPPQTDPPHHHRHHDVVPDFVAWDINGSTDHHHHRMCQDEILSFVQDNKNGVLESTVYAYTNCIHRQEPFLPVQQQQQQPHFYFSGEFSPLNGKSMDSNTWEGNM